MELPKITKAEFQLCLIIWENEPISSTDLVKLCKLKYQWAKSTTFTIIHRLCERGVIQNNKAIVRSLVCKESVQTSRLESLIDETFEGDTHSFIKTYLCSSKYSPHGLEFLTDMVNL